MPVFNVVLKEMKDAQVSHISLVDRGANRIPFKILKQESTGMAKHFAGLDLGQLFARKSEKDEAAEVVGLVAMQDDEEAKQRIAEAGFDTSKPVEQKDGTVVYAQGEGDFDAEDTSVIKWDNGIALITKGFRPYSMDVSVENGASFADQVKAQGFYPGIRTVMEVLTNSVSQAVGAGGNPGEAADMVGKMFDEAREYTMAFVRDLPEKAFKLDKEMPEGEEVPDGKKKKKKKNTDGSTCKEEGEEVGKVDPAKPAADAFKICEGCKTPKQCTKAGVCALAAKKSEADDAEEDVEVEESDDDVEGEDEEDEGGEVVQKTAKPKPKKVKDKEVAQNDMSETQPVEDVEEEDMEDEEVPPKGKKAPKKAKPAVKQDLTAEALLGMVNTKLEATLAKFTGALQSGLGGLADRVEKAESQVSAIDGKISVMLVPGSDSGDPIPANKGEKGSGVYGGRDIDTAFQPNIRKRAYRS